MTANRLLSLLDRDGDRSTANLKRRYRLLCQEAHPDHAGRHEAFLQLNAEYREALDLLRRKSPGPLRAEPPPVRTRAETRAATLERLRTYAFKFYSRDSGSQLERLIEAAAEYDPIRARLLRAYKAEFLDSYHSWLSDGRVYYAHAVLVAAVRQLFHRFDTGSARHSLLLERYLQDAREKARGLSPERGRIVEAFAEWLREEGSESPR